MRRPGLLPLALKFVQNTVHNVHWPFGWRRRRRRRRRGGYWSCMLKLMVYVNSSDFSPSMWDWGCHHIVMFDCVMVPVKLWHEQLEQWLVYSFSRLNEPSHWGLIVLSQRYIGILCVVWILLFEKFFIFDVYTLNLCSTFYVGVLLSSSFSLDRLNIWSLWIKVGKLRSE